ncbi:unnamed protein product [Lactuca virosa]|uniref:Uncharacterized protein n=1 Tax=Lactuca virosa TaxID=75947 RepID=A0AAU9NBS9_9ASTR|nr:unnamed protein product [Lactuca virosa]
MFCTLDSSNSSFEKSWTPFRTFRTEEAEADAEYDNAMKEAIQGVQDAVTTINEHLEEVRYEIAALEAE